MSIKITPELIQYFHDFVDGGLSTLATSMAKAGNIEGFRTLMGSGHVNEKSPIDLKVSIFELSFDSVPASQILSDWKSLLGLDDPQKAWSLFAPLTNEEKYAKHIPKYLLNCIPYSEYFSKIDEKLKLCMLGAKNSHTQALLDYKFTIECESDPKLSGGSFLGYALSCIEDDRSIFYGVLNAYTDRGIDIKQEISSDMLDLIVNNEHVLVNNVARVAMDLLAQRLLERDVVQEIWSSCMITIDDTTKGYAEIHGESLFKLLVDREFRDLLEIEPIAVVEGVAASGIDLNAPDDSGTYFLSHVIASAPVDMMKDLCRLGLRPHDFEQVVTAAKAISSTPDDPKINEKVAFLQSVLAKDAIDHSASRKNPKPL